jgi:signal transduction histidine kinase
VRPGGAQTENPEGGDQVSVFTNNALSNDLDPLSNTSAMTDMESAQKRILIVDDDSWVREALTVLLEMDGWLIRSAETARDAYAAFAEFSPDAVLLDIGLPDASGLDVLEKLKSDSLTPVIMMSGSGALDRVVASMRAGAETFLLKPFESDSLTLALEQAMRTAALRRSNQSLAADVSERRLIQAELTRARDAALAASKAKGEFLATMSHEIRTPLNAVIGLTGLLLDMDLTPGQREYAELIRTSGDELLEMVNGILDFSGIESGGLTLDLAEFDLRQTIEESLSPFLSQAREKGLHLLITVDAAVPPRLVGDAARIGEILANLARNAVEFTERGSIFVRVSAAGTNEGSALLRIEVEDTGLGISPEDQTRLFEAFTQVDGSMARRHGGIGLGLAMCARLVSLMQGQIGVDSKPGRGSTFWFTVNLAFASGAETPRTVRRRETTGALSTPPHPGTPRVLLAEDNRVNQRLTLAQLSKLGYRADVVMNGQEALDALEGVAYDVILMDCQMPGLDGLEATRRIRHAEIEKSTSSKSMCHVHIIALTANAMPGDRELCLGAGMDDYVVKPIRIEALQAALERAAR